MAKREERLRPLSPLQTRARDIVLVLAWAVGIGCGIQTYEQGDLLMAVLKGAAAWAGALAIGVFGINLCERIIGSARPAPRAPAEPPVDGSLASGTR